MSQIDKFTDKVITELEKARQDAGMTTQELISRSGIRRSTYFRKMRGQTDFTTSDIDAIAQALKVDPFLILRKASSAVKHETVEIDPSMLSEDEKAALAMRDLGQSDFGIAALRDKNKEKESEHFADEGA
jgi:transcriptional regulator with XRE-family HTH domain